MAEIAVLRTHIVNYAKTREVYVAYRKAGYSKKSREEHEEEILLHQAAKNAFDEMGVKKLPKVKELQTEYALSLIHISTMCAELKRNCEQHRSIRILLPMRPSMGKWHSTTSVSYTHLKPSR